MGIVVQGVTRDLVFMEMVVSKQCVEATLGQRTGVGHLARRQRSPWLPSSFLRQFSSSGEPFVSSNKGIQGSPM